MRLRLYLNYIYESMVENMMKKCFFTVNLLIRSESNIRRAIDSVIGDEKFFRENIQLNLIDSIGNDLSTGICSEYTKRFPENIYFIDSAGEKPAESYNHALPMSYGAYISYTDNYGIYSGDALKKAMEQLRGGKIPVFCCRPMYSIAGAPAKPYVDDIEPGIVRVHDTPDRFILMLGCYFFRNNIARSICFDKKFPFDYDTKFIIEGVLKTHTFVYSEKMSYTISGSTEREPVRYDRQYSTSYYSDSVKNFIVPMLKGYAGSPFVMSVMMYLIEVKFALNADERCKNVIAGSKVTEFIDECARALNFIDDTVIMNKRLCRICGLDPEMLFRFLRMKYRNPRLFPETDIVPPGKTEIHKYYVAENRMEALSMTGEFAVHLKNVLIARSGDITADIRAVVPDGKGLYFDAVMNGCSCLAPEDYRVYVSVNGERSPVEPTKVYTLRKYFGEPFLRRYSFRFYVPFSSGKKLDTACVYFKYGRLAFRIRLTFSGTGARLTNELKNSYALFSGRMLSYDAKSRSIVLRPASDSLMSLSENRLLSDIGKTGGLSARLSCGRIRRMARSVRRENAGKRILVFYDETGINYNGNLLFRYFYRNKGDDLEPYFITEHDSQDKTFLSGSGYENVLDIGSARSKAVVLAADYIYATDCDPYESLGFDRDDCIFYRDMMKAKIIVVRNFFLTYQTAQFDNRLRDNNSYVFCTSEREKKNLLSPIYGYSEDKILVTGSPQLDAVTDNREKLILISPGERRIFNIYNNCDYYRFSESAFFRAYEYILSDPRLIRACREGGWRIGALMPQSVEQYSKMFHTDDIVKIYSYSEKNAADLTAKASVLVTDYSELQYRFAYCGKRVLYYFPPGLPVNSEHNGENISSNGFGELYFEKEKLRDAIIEGIADSFKRPEKYEKRAKEFFGSSEKTACRRIFDESRRIMK